jgi:hypothetical protein
MTKTDWLFVSSTAGFITVVGVSFWALLMP